MITADGKAGGQDKVIPRAGENSIPNGALRDMIDTGAVQS